MVECEEAWGELCVNGFEDRFIRICIEKAVFSGSLGSCEGLNEREVEKWEREVFEREIKRRNDALKVDYRRGMVGNRSAFEPGAN